MLEIKGLFNDNESDIDYIGYTKYIGVFKYIIDNDEDLIQPPIVFGLHGDWGIGKSTFMNLLDKELVKNEYNITIRINPWEYRESNDIVSLFFVELYKKLKEKSLVEKLKDGFDKLFELIYPLKVKINTGIAGFEYDITKIKEIEKINMLDNYISESHLKKENIEKLFEKTFLSQYKIIVFIDDLDRCSVDKVINVLESVKLFLNTNKCIFFLGCDVNYLNRAVANYYEKFIKANSDISDNKKNQSFSMDENSVKRFTKEYLEKIIQVPFHIPAIDKNSMEMYIDSILSGDYPQIDDIKTSAELLKKTGRQFKTKVPKVLVKELFAARTINPRRIKRVLNIIYLNYLFLATKMQTVTLNDINLLVLLAVVNDEDHEFYEEYLSSKEVCIETFTKKYNILNKSDDIIEETDGIEKENLIESLFNVFFKFTKIGSIEDISSYLTNISNILTVSNITHIATDYNNKWGKLGEIESVSNTKRKIKTFLNSVDDEIGLDFCIWFLKTIFLKQYEVGKLQIGIYNNFNLLIFNSKNSIVEDYNRNFLFKFNYDTESKMMKVVLNTGKYTSKLNRNVFVNNEITITKENFEEIKSKLMHEFGEVK